MIKYSTIKNWTGKGALLVSEQPISIQEGDNYISKGFSGDNVFTAQKGSKIIARKVLAVSHDLEWGKTGNNTLDELPKLDF